MLQIQPGPNKLLATLLIGLLLVLTSMCAALVFYPTIQFQAGKISSQEIAISPIFVLQETKQSAADQELVTYQQFVSSLTKRFSNKEFAITLRHFSEPAKNFSVNGARVMNAASTYKLFTAYSMYKSGQAPECLSAMIVHSDNNCPENWGRWSLMTSDARTIGAVSTNLNAMPPLTTSDDLALFLTKLHDGSLLPSNETNVLLSFMKAQVFREGVPAGIPEAEVADKVGFLDGALNDAGIVYSPKGNFALVILTNGYSWQSIAEISAEIYAKI